MPCTEHCCQMVNIHVLCSVLHLSLGPWWRTFIILLSPYKHNGNLYVPPVLTFKILALCPQNIHVSCIMSTVEA